MKQTIILFSVVAFILTSCGSSSSGPTYDLKGYQTESIGGGAQYARFMDQNAWPLSTGHVINDVRNGLWLTYHANSYQIKTATNYINGKKNGPELVFNERGSLESRTGYRNDELQGLTATYRNGRVTGETNYAAGKMHGPFAIYDEGSGKIQRSGFFKNGLQDGELFYYDDRGNITLKYIYKDGEKISGGILE